MYSNDLNKQSELFIDEQRKFINYYKIKKTYGKGKEQEFVELLNKKGSDLFKLDRVDISLMTNSLNNMRQQIKTIIDRTNVKDSFNLDICEK